MSATIASLPPRMQAKVQISGSCWLWMGAVMQNGYGMVRVGGVRLVHRVAYELLVGPIPDGLEVDHLCRVRNCINPDHLEAVTHRENVVRERLVRPKKTHCPQGHEFTDENSYIALRPDGTVRHRACRECGRIRDRARQRRASSTPA